MWLTHGCLSEASQFFVTCLSIGPASGSWLPQSVRGRRQGGAPRCCWWLGLWRCKRCHSVPALAPENVRVQLTLRRLYLLKEGISYFKLSHLLVVVKNLQGSPLNWCFQTVSLETRETSLYCHQSSFHWCRGSRQHMLEEKIWDLGFKCQLCLLSKQPFAWKSSVRCGLLIYKLEMMIMTP